MVFAGPLSNSSRDLDQARALLKRSQPDAARKVIVNRLELGVDDTFDLTLDLHIELVTALIQQGEWADAYLEAKSIMDLAREHGADLHLARVLVLAGNLDGDRSRWDAATEHYNAAIGLAPEDHQVTLDAATGMGQIAWRTGRSRSTIPHVEAALISCTEIGDQRGEATCNSLLGTLHHQLGEVRQAKARFAYSLAAVRRLGDPTLHVQVLNNCGSLYREIGEIEEAMSMFAAAIEVARRHDLTRPLFYVLVNLGLAHLKEDRADLVTPLLDEASSLVVVLEDPYARNLLLFTNAMYNMRKGLLDEAAAALIPVLDRFEQQEVPMEVAETHFGMAKVAMRKGDRESALAELRKAEAIVAGIDAAIMLGQVREALAELGEDPAD